MPQIDSVAKLHPCNSVHFAIVMVSIPLPAPRPNAANITRPVKKFAGLSPVNDWKSSAVLLGHWLKTFV
jgi:hypothetical protein